MTNLLSAKSDGDSKYYRQLKSMNNSDNCALYKSINALTRSMSSEITNDVKVKVIF